jgi:hypothetical protein
VTINDAVGLSTTSTVDLTVEQTVTSIVVSPTTRTVKMWKKFQFRATAFDQFGATLRARPAFAWSVCGRGSITGSGVYTAARRAGRYTIVARAAGHWGAAEVKVVAQLSATNR